MTRIACASNAVSAFLLPEVLFSLRHVSPTIGMRTFATWPMLVVRAEMVWSSPSGIVIAGVTLVFSVGCAVTRLVTVPLMETPSSELLTSTEGMNPVGSAATMSLASKRFSAKAEMVSVLAMFVS